MAPRYFGQFLLERGIITREMLLDAIEHQKGINRPLCALAIEKGFLSKEQLEDLDAEYPSSDKKFLEIALKKNMLGSDQVEELEDVQSHRWMFLGEALAEKGYINLVQLEKLFEEYRKAMEPRDIGQDVAMADLPARDVISSLLDVTVELFVQYTKELVEVMSVERVDAEPEDMAYIFAQEITGDRNFHYALALPEELALSIAAHLLGETHAEMDEMVFDAVSEFVNVIIGHGCTKLSVSNVKVHAQPPRVMTREMIKRFPASSAVAVSMKTAMGVFRILFFFTED